jgi:Protein of unknown function DUF917, C-terminal/Hydantoinase/oxoprolinase N-terminal region
MQDLRLGVDVGGTNTDAVVLDGNHHVLAKAPTTPDVTTGIVQAIDLVLASGEPSARISAAMLGTTQCINAILEREHLGRVGIVRLGAPATLALPPLVDWPEDLRSLVGQASYIVAGGCEFDGREISPLDETHLRTVGRDLRGQVDAIAVSSVFAPVNPEHERRAAALLREAVGERVPISLSHEIGTLGLLERENATVLNAALMRVIARAVEAFRAAIALQDVRGNALLIRQVASARWAEQIARAATVAMGGSAAMALFCLAAADYRRAAIPGTVSLAARVGRAVRLARERHRDPVDAMLALLPGQQLCTGKVVDVERRTTQGFARGRVVLSSGSRRIGIDFQNEYLIAQDLETGEPLTTEVLRYGYQVAVLAIAAPGPLKSPEALSMVGPQAFGYPDPYRPLPGDLCTAAAAQEHTA